MASLKFSKTTLQALALPEQGKRLTIYDTETPKLALRATAAGTKTFYMNPSAPRTQGLGEACRSAGRRESGRARAQRPRGGM